MTSRESRIISVNAEVSYRERGIVARQELPPDKIRTAQLVLASAALEDPDREADLREVLSAAGLFTRSGKMQGHRPRLQAPNNPQVGRPRDWRQPGEREPSGRLSRRVNGRADRGKRKEEDEMIEVQLPDAPVDFVDIGPECFAAADGSVISWRGQNYVPQRPVPVPETPPDLEPEPAVDTFMGYAVNDFSSTVTYAIFNDPDGSDIRDLPEAIREQLLDVPLYEDESLRRVLDHARLMNEDRDLLTPARSHVKVRTQTLLKTRWTDVATEGTGNG